MRVIEVNLSVHCAEEAESSPTDYALYHTL